jgi:hypothetical protein
MNIQSLSNTTPGIQAINPFVVIDYNGDAVICLLRIVDGKGYISYSYADNMDEVEAESLDTKEIYSFASTFCKDYGAELYAY